MEQPITKQAILATAKKLAGYYQNLVSEEIEWASRNLQLTGEWIKLIEANAEDAEYDKLLKKMDAEGIHRGSGWAEMKSLISQTKTAQ